MLYAKINPTAKVYVQTNPFSGSEVNCDHMTALARPYAVGSTQTNFEVSYGTITIENNVPIKFNKMTSSSVTMTSAELSTWGTDDTILLTLIATKLGITASDFITINDSHPF